jgi:ribonuclease P protein component
MRVGIVVPRYGRTAVDRNRLKRRLRELVRGHLLPLDGAFDVVIWARHGAYELSFKALKATLTRLAARIPMPDPEES